MHIAITGSMGSGKSEVVSILKELKFPVLSADEIVHSLYEREDIKQKLVKIFSSQVLTCFNEVDKAYLSFRIFNNSREKLELEELIHPLVYKRLKEEAQKHELCFSEVPLLFETNSEHQFDQNLVVISDLEVAKKRLIEQRNLSAEEVEKRWANQMPIDQKIELADDVIENNGSRLELKEKVIQYLHKLKQ